ncbi:MAG: creatininase family protein [candidate division Zixibacteria bacterium]|nr:creatininase family protein [candidate division Zixibacteria bacterium]
MELRWDRLGWQDIDSLIKRGYDSVILPVGTIEAHGVIPLGTDNFIPETMAERIAEQTKSLIAPTVNYGITRTLMTYPGSLTVSPPTFQAYITEILMSMVSVGMKKLIVLNGHGGQFDELKAAAFDVFEKTSAKVAVIHWWVLCQDLVEKHYGTSGGHAAVDETAAIIACAPETVQKDKYDPEMLYYVRPGTNVYPNPSTVLIFKENTGELNFDEKTANSYFDDVCETVKGFIQETFKRWDQ